MTWLFEESLPAIVVGVVAAILLVLAWLHTGRRAFVYAALGSLAGVMLAVIVERSVVTDREKVDAVLRQAARDVEHDDLDALLSRLHSDSPQIADQARAEFPRYEFEDVTIKSNLKITFDQPSQPEEATARFNVSVTASERNGSLQHQRVPRFVVVKFRRDSGEWKVYSYEHHAPQQGLLRDD